MQKLQKTNGKGPLPEFRELALLLEKINHKHHLSPIEAISHIQQRIPIPLGVFSGEHTPLQSLAIYLHDVAALSFAEIGTLTGRDSKGIWKAYRDGHRAGKRIETTGSTSYYIFADELNQNLSVMECVIAVLIDRYRLNFHQTAVFLQRDERNIWTLYHRSLAKRGLQHSSLKNKNHQHKSLRNQHAQTLKALKGKTIHKSRNRPNSLINQGSTHKKTLHQGGSRK